MATLLKVLNNLADIKSAGGVALRVRTQGQRLKDLLDALGVHPASLHASETNSDLIGCNNECVNVVLERPAFGSTHIRRF